MDEYDDHGNGIKIKDRFKAFKYVIKYDDGKYYDEIFIPDKNIAFNIVNGNYFKTGIYLDVYDCDDLPEFIIDKKNVSLDKDIVKILEELVFTFDKPYETIRMKGIYEQHKLLQETVLQYFDNPSIKSIEESINDQNNCAVEM